MGTQGQGKEFWMPEAWASLWTEMKRQNGQKNWRHRRKRGYLLIDQGPWGDGEKGKLEHKQKIILEQKKEYYPQK